MMQNTLVYLSGPITAKHGYSVEENVAAALKVHLDLTRRGIASFCPHFVAAFPSAHADVPYEAWMAYDFAVIDRCTHMLMLDRWHTSNGAKREEAYAVERGLTVYYNIDALATVLARGEGSGL